jgi:NAD(P)-dependent dehydrogenase (short-subunit alcohol dehydrogenase family)
MSRYKNSNGETYVRKIVDQGSAVTGSSSGIGRAAVLAFAKERAAFVAVHYARNAEAAQAVVLR